jgi:cell fate regulator YaaT (PSP1 superfamily)
MDERPAKKEISYLPRAWGSAARERDQESSEQTPLVDELDAAGAEGALDSSSREEKSDVGDSHTEPTIWQEWIAENRSVQSSEARIVEETPLSRDERQVGITVTIVGVRFGYACKIYHFEAGDLALEAGEWVIVKTEKGMGLGQISIPPFEKEYTPSQLEGLRKVIRKAGKVDFDQKVRCAHREALAYAYCIERIDALGLPMKLVAVECFFDGSKYVFYFTSEGRVDFRELVKQLVARFPVRIEMRQIGVRHEAKMTGGLACCGQELCCSRFLTDFRPVSVKMAKNQNLSLNPSKISGVCGRLMCCLAYEHDTYEEFKKGLPRVGKAVTTPKGQGVVVKHNPMAEKVFVRLDEETIAEFSKQEILAEADAHARPSPGRGPRPNGPQAQSEEQDEEALRGLE